ncbi:unnamed protein product [Aphanomyces euteiches]|nr:hypothetical protein Ae201684P_020389 [Aphanomyces euteiches]
MQVALLLVAAIACVSRAELSNETANELSILADAVRKEYNLTESSEDNPVVEAEELTVVKDSPVAAPAPIYARQTNDGLALKILQVPDIHYTGFSLFPCVNPPNEKKWFCFEKYMTEMLGKMLDDVQPDFVVFSGDQNESIYWPQSQAPHGAIDAYSSPVRSRNLPWAMIFGNHDESYTPEIGSNKRNMIEYIETLPKSYSRGGPTDIGGVGNYDLSFLAPADGFWGNASKVVFRSYFMDTGKSGTVTAAQNNYMKQLAAPFAGQNIPALIFFHIPIPEYQEFDGNGQGEKGEAVSSKEQSGLFDTMVEMGDVVASFCGHDHLNDFCFQRKNSKINLCYGGGVGYGAAYRKSGHSRTARVIEWSWTRTKESITTWQYKHNQDNSNGPTYSLFERSF